MKRKSIDQNVKTELYMNNIFQKKTSRILPEHRKILSDLLLKCMEVSNIVDGEEIFQIDENSSRLATVALLYPAPLLFV